MRFVQRWINSYFVSAKRRPIRTPKKNRVCLRVEVLEERTTPAAPTTAPTDAEQLVLELINRARANPVAEVTRLSGQTWGDSPAQGTAFPAPQTPNLNEGLPAGTISTAAKQPLAFNTVLLGVSAAHSQYMIANSDFAHNETKGGANNTPFTRIMMAGYQYVTAGENIAASTVTSNTDPAVISATAAQEHDGLFIDGGTAGRGHRMNLMNSMYKEVGIGIATGDTTIFGTTQHTEVMTEDFATSATNPDGILTGVIFNDLTATRFYAPGEGLGGVTVTATPVGGGQSFTTTTWSTGGYSLPLPAGTYNVTLSGGGVGTTSPVNVLGAAMAGTVTIGTSNVEIDFLNTAAATPSVQFGAASETINASAGTFSITVNLSAAATQAVTVPFTLSGTAANGTDYSGVSASPLVIAAGQSSGTITGTLLPDPGPNKTLVFTLGTPTNATLGTTTVNTLTIAEPAITPSVQFGAASETVNASTGTFSVTVNLSAAATQTVSVPFTLSGTAANGTDYSGVSASPLVIAAGQSSGTITGTLLPDPGPNKTLVFTLGTPTNATLGTTTVNTLTIAEPAITPSVQFGVASETVNASTGTFSVTVKLSAAATQTVSVPFTVSGTAVAGTDYSGVSASPLSIAAGQTSATITGMLLPDPGANKTLIFTLGTPTNATLGTATVNTLTITEPTTTPTVQFGVASETVNASTGTFSVTVNLSAAATQAVSVPFTVSGTAVAGTDYSGVSASPLSIAAGQTSATITGMLLPDPGANKTLIFTLGTPTNATLGTTTANTLTITEPTITPSVQFGAASETVNASTGTFSITVNLSAAATQAVSVPFTVSGTAVNGTDYRGVSASPLSIAAGQTSATITGTLLPVPGGNTTLVLTLGMPTNATLGTTTVNTLTITEPAADVLAATAINSSVPESSAASVPVFVASFTDTNAATPASAFAATVMWSDGMTTAGTVLGGNGGFAVSTSRAFTKEAVLTARVTITGVASANTTSMVTVNEADVFVVTVTPPTGAQAGVALANAPVATFTDTGYPGNNGADFAVTINWGDNTAPTAGTVTGGNGNFTVLGSHTYATAGSYLITATVRDVDGTATAANSATIVVATPTNSPQNSLQSAYNTLLGLLNSQLSRNDRSRLRDATTEDLAAAVNPALYLDGFHLQPQTGLAVFSDTSDAVGGLGEIYNDKQSLLPKAAILSAINQILAADQQLAQIAINEAIAAGGDKRELQAANQEMRNAAVDLAQSRTDYDGAANHYGDAWMDALRSVGKVR